jgi:hypothetical protein
LFAILLHLAIVAAAGAPTWLWASLAQQSSASGVCATRDQVDALGLIGQLLDRMTACRPPKQEPELKRDDYCELQEQIGDDVLTL